ncbi:MAG: hypothetical protein COA92_00480 [Sulfurovum sp.]|nr:MAG: hypothetical protein COA92_00480 [Sulfurovum sp.]
MKKVTRTLLAMMAVSNISFAGGDFTEAVEPVVVVPVAEVDHSGFYLGIGLSAVLAYEDGVSRNYFKHVSGQERTGDLALLAGYDFNEYIAVEARYLTTFTHDDILERTMWSVYVKPQYPVTEEFSIYALLGYGDYQLDGVNNSGIDIDESGFQWGLGASYEVIEDFYMFVDYIFVADNVDVPLFFNPNVSISSDAITAGVTYKF